MNCNTSIPLHIRHKHLLTYVPPKQKKRKPAYTCTKNTCLHMCPKILLKQHVPHRCAYMCIKTTAYTCTINTCNKNMYHIGMLTYIYIPKTPAYTCTVPQAHAYRCHKHLLLHVPQTPAYPCVTNIC